MSVVDQRDTVNRNGWSRGGCEGIIQYPRGAHLDGLTDRTREVLRNLPHDTVLVVIPHFAGDLESQAKRRHGITIRATLNRLIQVQLLSFRLVRNCSESSHELIFLVRPRSRVNVENL